MPRRPLAALVLVLGFLVQAAWAQPTDAPARVTEVTVQSVDGTVTVSVATAGAPKYRSELIDGPFRLILDFEDTLYGWKKSLVPVGADPVKEIRGSQFRKGVARVVIELTRKAPYRVETQAGGVRVVFAPMTKAAPPASQAPLAPPAPAPSAPPPVVALPAAPPPAAPPPAAPAKATVPPTWRLEGIVVNDGVSAAYIVDSATNQVRRYVVGDRIGDGLVEAIEQHRVVLRMPRDTIELRIEERRPPPSPKE